MSFNQKVINVSVCSIILEGNMLCEDDDLLWEEEDWDDDEWDDDDDDW